MAQWRELEVSADVGFLVHSVPVKRATAALLQQSGPTWDWKSDVTGFSSGARNLDFRVSYINHQC